MRRHSVSRLCCCPPSGPGGVPAPRGQASEEGAPWMLQERTNSAHRPPQDVSRSARPGVQPAGVAAPGGEAVVPARRPFGARLGSTFGACCFAGKLRSLAARGRIGTVSPDCSGGASEPLPQPLPRGGRGSPVARERVCAGQGRRPRGVARKNRARPPWASVDVHAPLSSGRQGRASASDDRRPHQALGHGSGRSGVAAGLMDGPDGSKESIRDRAARPVRPACGRLGIPPRPVVAVGGGLR